MQRFTVTGMSCAACSSRVEKAVSSLEGVSSCSVNLLTGSMGVEGTVSSADIVAASNIANGVAEHRRSKEGTHHGQLFADRVENFYGVSFRRVRR